MALDFPTSPSVGQRTSIDNKTWEYNGKGWKLVPNQIQGIQGTGGFQGIQGLQGPLSNNQGTQGTQGRQGLQGLSNQGTQGLQGLQGTFGPATIPRSTDTTGQGDTIVLADNGKIVSVAASVRMNNVFDTAGQNVVVYNQAASGICTIFVGSGMSMYLAGTTQTGTRYLQQRGLATIICVTASITGTPPAEYVISGAGVT